jgi:diketogulonate reductase-like aldo/keto reductase
MEDSLRQGKCRAIGVSNFTVSHLKALKETATVWPPAVNQVELHPYHSQVELREYCASEGIAIQAYASLGGQDAGKGTLEKLGGSLLSRREVLEMAEKHGASPAGVLLRWATQRGIAVLPKSTAPKRMAENLAAASGALPYCLSPESSSSSSGKGSGGGASSAAEQEGKSPSPTQQGSSDEWKLDESDMAALDALDQSESEASRLCWARDPLKSLDFE